LLAGVDRDEDKWLPGGRVEVHLAALLGVPGVDHGDEPGGR
jgi:hypothetical protein